MWFAREMSDLEHCIIKSLLGGLYMQKIIVRNIAVFSFVGLLLVALVTFSSLSETARLNQDASSEVLLEQVATKLVENEQDIENLKSLLSTEYIEKARAFAHMIKLEPSIIDDKDELIRIMNELGVDELHVTDDKGVLLWGTIDSYIGFDFATSDQASAFMRILDDPSYELAQEPTINGAEGKLFQYVGVARQDKKGIVQVGILPSRLDEALANNSIQNVVKGYKVGTKGFIFAVNNESNTIEAFPDTSYIGKTVSESGLKLNTSDRMTNYAGETYYYNKLDTDGYTLICMMPKSEMYAMRNTSLKLTLTFISIVFVGLVIIIAFIIKQSITNSLNRMVSTVKKIKDGDMKARVNEQKFEEFAILSDGINGMVESIDKKMNETGQLMKAQQALINQVIGSTNAINTYTADMRRNSESISVGATSQAASVEEISRFCDSLLAQVNDNNKNAMEANNIALESQEKLNSGMELIDSMSESMAQMDEASRSIGQIISTVSNIAFQTNILALNASVEAARAGEHGKGFSVVAQEVRNLAGKCSDAAESTKDLIEHTLETVKKGQNLSDEVSESMRQILERTKESTKLISDISKAVAMQVSAVGEMSIGLNQISEVIQKNAVLATEAETTANKLFGEVDRLDRMVSKK